ncbi:MAG: ADP-ribosylation factor-like protein [Promethearchaeota archaeon]
MTILALSYFDTIYGPRIFWCSPQTFMRLEVVLDQLPPLMNLEEEDVFYYDFRYEFGTRQINLGILKSSNLIFQVQSPLARGGYEGLMVSHLHLMADPDLEADREVLTTFVEEFKEKVKDAYQAFHPKKLPTAADKEAQIKSFIEEFHESIPQETAMVKHEARLLLVGLRGSGKKSVTRRIREIFYDTDTSSAKLSVNVLRFLLGNLRVTTYNLPDGDERGLWRGYFKNKNGVIFVVDAASPEKFDVAREWLEEMRKIPEASGLPKLVLLNKMDAAACNPNEVARALGVDGFEDHTVRSFPASALKNEGFPVALNWIAMEVFKRVAKGKGGGKH